MSRPPVQRAVVPPCAEAGARAAMMRPFAKKGLGCVPRNDGVLTGLLTAVTLAGSQVGHSCGRGSPAVSCRPPHRRSAMW